MRPSSDRDPLKELLTVQKRMNKLFESALERTDFDAQDEVDTWTPVADVYEAPDAWCCCASSFPVSSRSRSRCASRETS